MAKGSGSAKIEVLFVVGILYFLFITKPIYGATFIVGGSNGWTFNVNNWPNGKSFSAGDILVFNYDKTAHNVAIVSKEGYDSCTLPTGSKVYQNGIDGITLRKGPNYFICTFPGHCQSGMKINVNAS